MKFKTIVLRVSTHSEADILNPVMRKTSWKGIIYCSLSHPKNVLCPRFTYSSRVNFSSRQITSQLIRQPLSVAKMANPRHFSAVASTEPENEEDYDARYRPFLLDDRTRSTDWISALELDTVTKMAQQDLLATGQPLRVLVLYGSLRRRYIPPTLLGGTARIRS